MLKTNLSRRILMTKHQLACLLMLIFNSLCYYFCIIELVCTNVKGCIMYVYIFLSFLLLSFAVLVTMTNPRDLLLRREIENRRKIQMKQTGAYALTIVSDCGFCTICCSYVNRKSRHCRKCDYCTEGFDHHCKWINNCIGRTNYKYFFCLLMITLLFLVYVAITTFFVLITTKSFKEYLITALVSIVFCVLDGIYAVNVLALILFHVWLRYKGMTTYEYLTMKRKEEKEKENRRDKGKMRISQFNIRNKAKDTSLINKVKVNGNSRKGIGKIVLPVLDLTRNDQCLVININNSSMELMINNMSVNNKNHHHSNTATAVKV